MVIPSSMSGRLSHFYALVLLSVCLVTNIVFFEKVREPFFGDEDPMASVKSSFSDLGIQVKIAEFFPKTQSQVDAAKIDEAPDTVPLTPPEEKPVSRAEFPEPRTERFVPREPRRQPALPEQPMSVDPIADPFQPLVPPPEVLEEPKPAVSIVVSERQESNLQTSAIMSAPAPVVAVVQSVVAEQFKPIPIEPKPVAPVKPSSAPVWDTADTIFDRPIRYD